LLITFNTGDYHGFLKSAYRFEVYEGLEEKIDLAINILFAKGQTHDAVRWQRKFQELKAKSR